MALCFCKGTSLNPLHLISKKNFKSDFCSSPWTFVYLHSKSYDEAEVGFPFLALILLQSPLDSELILHDLLFWMGLKTGGIISVHSFHCTHKRSHLIFLKRVDQYMLLKIDNIAPHKRMNLILLLNKCALC